MDTKLTKPASLQISNTFVRMTVFEAPLARIRFACVARGTWHVDVRN